MPVSLNSNSLRKSVALCLVLQATGIGLWWGWLWLSPSAVDLFQPADWPREVLLSFWLADLWVLVLGSCLAAGAIWRHSAWGATAVWSLATAASYPTLYCLAASCATGQAWTATAMMAGLTGFNLVLATVVGMGNQPPAIFRVAHMTRPMNLIWTLLQTIAFWCLFLWIVPLAIVEIEHRLGLTGFQHAGQTGGSLLLFLSASALGLWSGWTMALAGEGTPLPTATASQLVVQGPYRLVRNPMAVAGILQGVSVGWWLGSVGVVAFSLGGGFLWHWLVRPAEEADLEVRFGDDYRRYQQATGLWIPRR